MRREIPNVWSASVSLASANTVVAIAAGTTKNVIYHGRASIDGSTDCGRDCVISIESPQERVRSATISILLVEDDHNTLWAYAKLLSMDGHTVYTADGYQAALNVAKTRRVDFAICDINLWDGNGCDLLKELQRLQPVKAIAVTSFASPDELQDYRDAGFANVLPKPVEGSALKSAVSHMSLLVITDWKSPAMVTASGSSIEPAASASCALLSPLAGQMIPAQALCHSAD